MALSRNKNIREIPPDMILIFTEGTKTEPNYFESFRIRGIIVRIIGLGMNTLTLVEEAIEQRAELIDQFAKESEKKPKTITYKSFCVFDKDSFTASAFNSAIDKARSHGFSVAYSNEAFELWYLLHFEYLHSGLTRDKYISKLSKILKEKYKKNDQEIYRKLYDKQEIAIKNSGKLLASHPSINPAKNNPSTTVYELVEYLNQFLRK